MHGVHLVGHPLHAGPELLPHDHLLRGLLDEQPACLGGDVRLAECGLPDGRGGEEGLAVGLLIIITIVTLVIITTRSS